MRAPSRAALVGSALAVIGSFLLRWPSRPAGRLPRWVPWAGVVLGTSVAANEVSGKPVPFLRWSVLRLALGSRHLAEHWQVGDGREQALADYVLAGARPGDVDDAIRVIDEFCYRRSLMINVGDEKGAILDRIVQQVQPQCVLELGTYCGYSALRIVRMLPPQARLVSVEFSPANADIARRLLQHAGVADRVTVVVGTLGDGGRTVQRLRTELLLGAGSVDLVFLDHDKDAYVPDLERILGQGWLRDGSVVVADNVRFPGAPAYWAYLRAREGSGWRTVEHHTHAEYQSVFRDVMLESSYQVSGTGPVGL